MATSLSVTLRAGGVAFAVLLLAPAARGSEDACLDASERARRAVAERRLLDARAHLRECAAMTCDAPIREICDVHLAEVVARLPTVIFDAKDAEGRDVPTVRTSIDGAVSSEGTLGAEVTLDPGVHVFTFEVAGMPVVERRLVLVEREKGRRERVRFASEPRAGVSRPPRPSPTPLRTAGWLTLGAGAVGLGVGAAFGVTAIRENDAAGCDASNVCDDPRARHQARLAASTSTVAFAIGGALTMGGALLVWLGRDTTAVARWARWGSF